MSFRHHLLLSLVWAPLAATGRAAPGFFPTEEARNVCPDTTLQVTFGGPVALGARGKIRIVEVDSGQAVETIDTDERTAVKTIGEIPGFTYYPVILSGNTAALFPRSGVLRYGKSYRVQIDAGALLGPGGAAPALTWRFTTKPAPPAANAARLVVAADGSGDFCTVQGALDFIPEGNTLPRTLFLRKGTYREIVAFANKHWITLIGEDRHETVISYPNNTRLNDGGGNPFGGKTANPSGEARVGGHIYHRGMFLAHRAVHLTLENLTFHNSTPSGGSQAEAIILNGTAQAHAVLRDLDLASYQDTLQINGQAFVSGCHIEGDVDFVWGTGPCFFENCVLHSLRSSAFYTQIRNPGTNHGYVFVRCAFEGSPGVSGDVLSRIGTGRFPHSEVVLIDCTLTSAVSPAGWLFSGGREGDPNDPAEVHFWEFNSRDPDGQPVDTSRRLAGSRRLEEPKDGELIAHYRDPEFVLGGGWSPP